MARYNTLKAAITAAIKTNGQQQITGQSLQTQLLNMVTALGKYFQSYGGLVTPTDSFTAGDESVLFFATEAGTYTDFGGVTLDGKSLHILYYDGSWHDEDTAIPSGAILDEKADKEGEYPALVAGSAQGLVGVAETSMEFLCAALPESAGTGAALLKAVKGKSIVWNQLVAPGATEVATISGHKYLTRIGGVDAIVTSTGAAIAISDASADNVHDLTLLGLGDLTVAQFRALFPRTDFAYNPGEVLPFAGERLRATGVNQWDEKWEQGRINYITGVNESYATGIRSKNYIEVIIGSQYYVKYGLGGALFILEYDSEKNYLGVYTNASNNTITIGSNTRYIRFYTTSGLQYFNDICINLSNPAINGQYFPYETHDLALNPATIKDKDGNLVFPYGGMHGKGTAFDALAGLVGGYFTKGRRVWDRRAYAAGDESDASVITDGLTYTFTQLATPVEVELAEPIPATLPVQQGGTLAVLPENTDGPYTAPASIVAKFPLRTSSIISKGTLTNLLEALKTAGVIAAYTMTYDASTGDYTFTITKEDAVTISEGE